MTGYFLCSIDVEHGEGDGKNMSLNRCIVDEDLKAADELAVGQPVDRGRLPSEAAVSGRKGPPDF